MRKAVIITIIMLFLLLPFVTALDEDESGQETEIQKWGNIHTASELGRAIKEQQAEIRAVNDLSADLEGKHFEISAGTIFTVSENYFTASELDSFSYGIVRLSGGREVSVSQDYVEGVKARVVSVGGEDVINPKDFKVEKIDVSGEPRITLIEGSARDLQRQNAEAGAEESASAGGGWTVESQELSSTSQSPLAVNPSTDTPMSSSPISLPSPLRSLIIPSPPLGLSAYKLSFSKAEAVVIHEPTEIMLYPAEKTFVEQKVNDEKNFVTIDVVTGSARVLDIAMVDNRSIIYRNPLSFSLPPKSFEDTDQDGLSDAYEEANELNMSSADSDDDGLSDREEMMIYPTNPLKLKTFEGPWNDDKGFVEWAGTHATEISGELGSLIRELNLNEVLYKDRDGITDVVEAINGFNYSNWDTDGDAASDGYELVRGRNVLKSDAEASEEILESCSDCFVQMTPFKGNHLVMDVSLVKEGLLGLEIKKIDFGIWNRALIQVGISII